MSRPRTGRAAAPDVSETGWAMMTDSLTERPAAGTPAAWDYYEIAYGENGFGGASLRDLWTMHGAGIVTAWQRERPGTRPKCFWMFSAPDAAPDRGRLREPGWASFAPPAEAEQAALLAGWGLLTPAEVAALARLGRP